MTPDERWLATMCPFVRGRLPAPPYFFPGLAGVSEAREQAAIDAGELQAGRITYAGRRRA